MTEQNIHLQKLKRGTKILLETKECVFDIEVLSPDSAIVSIIGGKRFIKPTEVRIIGAFGRRSIEDEDTLLADRQIERNIGLEIQYNDKDNITSDFISSPILSAKLYGDKWSFEMWKDETKDKLLEDHLEEARARTRIKLAHDGEDGTSNENTLS